METESWVARKISKNGTLDRLAFGGEGELRARLEDEEEEEELRLVSTMMMMLAMFLFCRGIPFFVSLIRAEFARRKEGIREKERKDRKRERYVTVSVNDWGRSPHQVLCSWFYR